MQYPIVKPYLPDQQRYQYFIEQIYQRAWLTNHGPCVQQLESQLADYLGVPFLLLVANGTLALQVAYKTLGLAGQVLTTPFSFAATASSLCWQQLTPVFVDVSSTDFTLNIAALEQQLQQNPTITAIVGVHVYGNPCDVLAIEQLAQKYQVKVIYDAAHAFGVHYQAKNILTYGDAATLSLHATKLFHSVEGGAIVFKQEQDYVKAKQLINFGFNQAQFPELIGINAKMSEMHAAMGLAMLDDIDNVIKYRQHLVACYQQQLLGCVEFQQWRAESANNGAYMPILLPEQYDIEQVQQQLLQRGVQTRRYFWPSLAQVPAYGKRGVTPVADKLAEQMLCLPLYYDLTIDDVVEICHRVKAVLT